MYSRWLSGLGRARNFASHSRSVAEFARVNPCSGSSSAPVETRPNRQTNRIPVIAMRRIGTPGFLTLTAVPAVFKRGAYCKEFAGPSLSIPRNIGRAVRFLRSAWDFLRPLASSCVARKEGTAAPPSPRAPGPLRFDPREETAPAPKVHREESQTEISAGISRASRDIQKWRRRADTN